METVLCKWKKRKIEKKKKKTVSEMIFDYTLKSHSF